MKNNEPDVTKKQEEHGRNTLLEEIIRDGARRMLQVAIEDEVKAYIELFKETKDNNGRRLVVRNGFLPERSLLTGIGPIPIKQPRVGDKRGEQFTSSILPRHLRWKPSSEILRRDSRQAPL